MKCRNFISTILELANLKYLDISSEKDEPNADEYFSHVVGLLIYDNSLPNLTFLDLSGKLFLNHIYFV